MKEYISSCLKDLALSVVYYIAVFCWYRWHQCRERRFRDTTKATTATKEKRGHQSENGLTNNMARKECTFRKDFLQFNKNVDPIKKQNFSKWVIVQVAPYTRDKQYRVFRHSESEGKFRSLCCKNIDSSTNVHIAALLDRIRIYNIASIK